MSAVFVFKVELCLPTKHIAQYFLNGDWRIDKWEKWEIKIVRLQERFYALTAPEQPDGPTQGEKSLQTSEIGFLRLHRLQRSYLHIRAFVLTHTCVHAHVSTLTHQIASPRHRFSALRHGVVTSCHGVLLMPTIVSY